MSKADDKTTTVKPARKRAQFKIFEIVEVADIAGIDFGEDATADDACDMADTFKAWVPVKHPEFETNVDAKKWRDANCIAGIYPIVRVMGAKAYRKVSQVRSEAVEV